MKTTSQFLNAFIHRYWQAPFLLLTIIFCVNAFASTVTEIEKQSLEGQVKSATVQGEIDRLYSEEQQMDQQYRALLSQLSALENSNLELQKRIDSQLNQQRSLKQQLESVAQIKREITPLMTQMQHSLVEFVQADLPFLKAQRIQGLQALDSYLADVENPLSSKYQKIIEAFEEQAEFGFSMSSYQGLLELEGQQVQVNFLRLGRVALYYQTLDSNYSARWSKQSGRWVTLVDQSSDFLSKAIAVAQGKAVADLLTLDLGSFTSSLSADTQQVKGESTQ